MKNVLLVSSSPRGAQSFSHRIAQRVVDEYRSGRTGCPSDRPRPRSRDPLPHLGEAFVSGMMRPAGERTSEEAEALDRSDRLIDELVAADVVVIAAPMHNFGIPSGLKAWIDHVARAGRTFRYGATGPEGLLKGKRALLVVSRGGIHTKGPMLKMEFQESYLRGVLGFLGITDVEAIRIEGVAMGEAAARDSLEGATARASTLAIELGAPALPVAA